MNKSVRILAVSAMSLAILPCTVFSQESDEGASSEQRGEMTREERRAAWESLSKEEKQAKREARRTRQEQRRAEWEAMTPEEREAKRTEMRAKWEAMTPEEREAMKKRRKQRGQRGNHGRDQDQSE